MENRYKGGLLSFRAVGLPDEVIDKVEDDIPTTPTLLEAKYSVFPDLEASFDKFYTVRFCTKQFCRTNANFMRHFTAQRRK